MMQLVIYGLGRVPTYKYTHTHTYLHESDLKKPGMCCLAWLKDL